MIDLYDLLARHGIAYERHDHPAVFTVEEAGRPTTTHLALSTR